MTPLKYLQNLALWLDEGANAVLGHNAHETISERAALARHNGKRWGCILCRILDWISKGHCDGAYQALVEPPIQDLKDL